MYFKLIMRTSRKYKYKRGSLVYNTKYGYISIYRIISSERTTKYGEFKMVKVRRLLSSSHNNCDIEKLLLEHLKIINDTDNFTYVKYLKKFDKFTEDQINKILIFS